MPVGVLEMNPAIPKPALTTASLSVSFTSHLLVRNSLAEPFLRFFLAFDHGDLLRTGSPELMGAMVSHAVAHLHPCLAPLAALSVIC
jgi:hypothetical protein